MLEVQLPDASSLKFDQSVSCGDVAAQISPRLAKAAVAAELDGSVVGLDRELPADGKVTLRILTKKDKFVGAFMGGRVKLKKGNTVGALALGPHAGNLVDVLTQVDLKFPDDLSPEELEAFKKDLAAKRSERGI